MSSCDSGCGLAGKTRFFGRMPKVEHKEDKCSQGNTWQKCGNLPPCAGDNINLLKMSALIYMRSSFVRVRPFSQFNFQKRVMPWLLDIITSVLSKKRRCCMLMAPPKFAAQLPIILKMFETLVVIHF